MERLYTLKEAKKVLDVTTKTIHRWDKEGKIRVVRTIGGKGGEYLKVRLSAFLD